MRRRAHSLSSPSEYSPSKRRRFGPLACHLSSRKLPPHMALMPSSARIASSSSILQRENCSAKNRTRNGHFQHQIQQIRKWKRENWATIRRLSDYFHFSVKREFPKLRFVKWAEFISVISIKQSVKERTNWRNWFENAYRLKRRRRIRCRITRKLLPFKENMVAEDLGGVVWSSAECIEREKEEMRGKEKESVAKVAPLYAISTLLSLSPPPPFSLLIDLSEFGSLYMKIGWEGDERSKIYDCFYLSPLFLVFRYNPHFHIINSCLIRNTLPTKYYHSLVPLN